MAKLCRREWFLGGAMALCIAVVPFFFYRWEYTHAKRLREVEAGKLYRCGQLTEAGFREAVERLGIRTIVNLQDEYPDPEVDRRYFGSATIPESELCRRLGVRYVYIPPDLVAPRAFPAHRPRAIEQFLAVMDDPSNAPVLIHCRAGLHRTGVIAAVYRMEYNGWSPHRAAIELRANGFGEFAGSAANEYVRQYVLNYRPRQRGTESAARANTADAATPAAKVWFAAPRPGSAVLDR